MDRTEKLLKKLNEAEFSAVERVIEQLLSRDTKNLDIKKLRGHRDVFRARVGNIRIIFRTQTDNIEILEISRRNEATYRGY